MQTPQPIETLVSRSAVSNLPLYVENAPEDLQAERLQMQTLSKAELLAIAQSQVGPAQYERHLQLLEHNKDNQLNPAKRQALTTLRLAADHFMLRKAYALAVKWQGHRVPSLDELPVPQ